MVNPFVDESPDASAVTTASMEVARAAPVRPGTRQRDFPITRVDVQDGTVEHWPAWFEDPFDEKGSEDGRFALTWEDYLVYAFGPGRLLVNTMGFPISVLVTRPLTVMCSDGKLSRQALGYDHDATPCPGGTIPPIDILEIGTYSSGDHDEEEYAPSDPETSDVPAIPVTG